jgi:enamine deaminase RidA (YjgF/YER057c/UK114 family)
VPAVRAGARLFVAGHDPERDGRLVYRGRVGAEVAVSETAAALRLATQNALASAREAAGPLDGLRCVVLASFVSTASPDALDPTHLEDSLGLLAAALGPGRRPAVWLRPAQGLAGGMSVEVELLLETRRRLTRGRRARRPKGRPGRRDRAAGRGPRRSGGRTS